MSRSNRVLEARDHLAVALAQTLPDGDHIIIDRVLEAYRLLGAYAIEEGWLPDPDWCYECDRPKNDCACVPTVVMDSGSHATIDNLDLPEDLK